MLDNSNHHNSTCEIAEQIVSYLYGEVNTQEKTVFETHLRSCSTCAKEFADISAVHSAVIEWRNEEFLTLEVHSIEIPYKKPREFYNAKIDSKVSRSWFEELGRLFSVSPALTTSASFALFAICIGIIFFANKSTNNVEVADINSKSTKKMISSPKNGNENFPNTAPSDDFEEASGEISSGEQSKSLAARAKNDNQKTAPDSSFVRKDLILKVSNDSRNPEKNLNRKANSQKNKETSFENKKLMFAQTDKISRLNNVEEDEDKSLRLAELFEDDGAK
jgi:hypothetical protein